MTPRDLALFLLASGDLVPRQRARDQQADRAGLLLKRRFLEHVAALDPGPAELDAVLLRVVENLGEPTGPVRALAREFRDDWRTAHASPGWLAHLRDQATRGATEDRHGGRVLP